MRVKNHTFRERCPLCDAAEIAPAGPLNYGGRVGFSSNEIYLDSRPELWTCAHCRSRFVQFIVDADTARQLYSGSRAAERWSTEVFALNKTDKVIDRMTSLLSGKVGVLDVGCNTGELLDFARDMGCMTAGVEYSSASREILLSKGHQAYSALEESPGGYDVITAFDLVEHLYDVPGFLASCRAKLSARGKLVVLTGDIGSLSARLAGRNWWYVQYPEHIVFPTRKFFAGFSGMRLDEWTPTYASKGYVKPAYRIVWELAKNLLRGRRYSGLPALGPDHALVVLSK